MTLNPVFTRRQAIRFGREILEMLLISMASAAEISDHRGGRNAFRSRFELLYGYEYLLGSEIRRWVEPGLNFLADNDSLRFFGAIAY
jgi:hypothetical protein